MTTQRKIAANRRNAKKSTGPCTPAGKAVVALNALKHGALSALTVIPNVEDAAAWEQHRDGVVTALRPVGLLETRLAERAAGLLWRIQRVERFEALSVLAAVAKGEMPPRPAEPPKPSDLSALFGGPPTDGELARDRAERAAAAERRAAGAGHALALLGDLGRKKDDTGVAWQTGEWLLDRAADVMEEEAGVASTPRPENGREFVRLVGAPEGTEYDDLDWNVGLVRAALAALAGSAGRRSWDVQKLTGYLDFYLADDRDQAAKEAARYRAELEALRERMHTTEACDRVSRLLPEPPVADRVQRYESHLGRQLTQTLKDLERLQAARAGAPDATTGASNSSS